MSQLPIQLAPIVVASADAVGGVLYLGRNHVFAVQAVWDDGLVGGLGLEASVDGVHFEPIPSSEQAISVAGGFLWNYTAAGFSQVRPYFDRTSGSGSIAVTGDAKGAR